MGNKEDWNGPDEQEAIELVRTTVNLGCNFFDMAPNYGKGKSELILGQSLKGYDRQNLVINTKVGHISGEIDGFAPDVIRRTVENSLKKLKTD